MCTPLQESLYALCFSRAAGDREFQVEQGIEGPGALCMGDALFEAYRLFKLRKSLRHASTKSRHYRRLFAEHGIDAGTVDSFEGLSRLPLTAPEQISASPFSFLCCSQSKVERALALATSGTTGPPKRIFFSAGDVEAIIEFMACGLATVADESDSVLIILPEGPHRSQSELLSQAAERIGAVPAVSGVQLTARVQIDKVLAHSPTVLFAETHLLYRITKQMEDSVDLGSLGIKTLFTSTSHASPAMRGYLSRAWRAQVTSHYGLAEMGLGLAVECPACGARHFNELDVHAEVIDPESGRVLPLGSEGELVFTTLNREAMPLIRYRSRDIAVLDKAKPGCASSNLHTIGEVRRRSDNTVMCRGVQISPTTFHEALFAVPEVVDYQVTMASTGDSALLEFDVELKDRSTESLSIVKTSLSKAYDELGLPWDEARVAVRDFKEEKAESPLAKKRIRIG
jgi:phenylacetate-coenzyme A ligase PaaK-like adenylate-forming protein